MFEQSIGHEVDEDGKGQDARVMAAALLLKDLVELVVIADMLPEQEDGLGQR